MIDLKKSDTRFDIWLDEKKDQLREDKYNKNIISYGFGDYRTIHDYPIRGRSTYLHVRKRKWLDQATGEIFSYGWDVSEFDGMRLSLTPSLSLFLKKEIESTPVSISTLAARNGLNGQTLRKQYKEVISDYRIWNQLGHADEYILYYCCPTNIKTSAMKKGDMLR